MPHEVKGKKIVVAEDDREVSTLIALTLRMEGYEVVTAVDGAEALEAVRAHHPDLVLLDVMMSHLSGYEVAHALQDDPQTVSIPIIFVTANDEIEDRVLGLSMAIDYIGKPFSVPELMARIAAALRMQALINETKALVSNMQAQLDQHKQWVSSPTKSSGIFLCHASEDKPRVRKLAHALDKKSLRTWLDEKDILPGEDWDLSIRKALKSADIVLVCLSPKSTQKRGYVQKEIRWALDILDQMPEGHTFLIPVIFEDCEVPDRLNSRQAVRLYEDNGLDRLIQAIMQQLVRVNQQTETGQ